MDHDTIVCIASGPSLNRMDVMSVEDQFLVAVNSSFAMSAHCDVLVAGDAMWWRENGNSVPDGIQRVTCSRNAARRYNADYFKPSRSQGYNSGQTAIEWAILKRPRRIILLGYDCSLSQGTHWHGRHPRRNPTVERVRKWRKQFSGIKTHGVDVVNCSRHTDLTCFRCAKLEDEL